MQIICDGGLSSWNTSDTMDALLLTKNVSYIDGIKLDVRMTKDYFLVLSKYDDLSKLTFSNKKVCECNYDYLRKVKFPSHIFKYYIPLLEELLIKYNKKKIIFLELFCNDNLDIFVNKLYKILSQYKYKYYFISSNNLLLKKLEENNFDKLGEIINEKSNVKLYKSLNEEDDIDNNSFLIVEHPEKVYKNKQLFDKIHGY